MRKRSLLRATVFGLVLVLTAAACGDDDESSATPRDDGRAGNEEAIARAQEVVDRFLQPPTGVGVADPLSKLPPTGKRLVWVGCPTGTCVNEGNALAEAAALFGWTVEQMQYGLTPEDIQATFTRAIDSEPDAIMTSAVPVELTEGIRARMAAESIPMFECCNFIPDDMENPPVSILGDQHWTQFLAELVVQWQVVKTEANVHNLLVTAPDFPILAAGTEAYNEALAEACPDTCTTKTLNITVGDIGTRLPGQVVSELQRDPDINYVTILGSGPFATGVAAAIREAGLQDQVRIVGTAPDTTNFENMLAGDEEMWIGFSERMIGWRLVDMYARHLVGDELPLRATGPDDDGPAAWPTTQYLTAETWPVAEPWEQPQNFEEIFKELWGV